LKLIRNRETLFDEDKNGLLYYGAIPASASAIGVGNGSSIGGNRTSLDPRMPVIFPSPLKFVGGDELDVYVNMQVVSTNCGVSCTDAMVNFLITEKMK